MRIGIGIDFHKFAEGRKFILGGAAIEYEFGLLGHSDADALAHAIADALLGAADLGDIGKHFPDTDAKYKGISSMILLQLVENMLKERQFKIGNIDCVVILQQPKISRYVEQMKINISDALNISENQISIKATTSEYMGFAGRKEGIGCFAIALLEELHD